MTSNHTNSLLPMFTGFTDEMDIIEPNSNPLPGADLYSTGQPLDQEPSMGQVPIVPPGTPPNDSWVHFSSMGPGGFLGRRSPNLPMSHPLMPNDMLSQPGHARGVIPPECGESQHNYPDYPPVSNPNHVEVY